MKVKILKDKAEKIIGLSNKSKINKDESYLFTDTNKITMKDTSFPLGLVFLDKKNRVTSKKLGKPYFNGIYSDDLASFVLEIHPDALDKIKVGQILDINRIKKLKFKDGGIFRYSMLLLDHKGNPQMKLQSRELIISRKETKQLIDKAVNCNTDEDFYELGKLVYDIRKRQRKRQPEYVSN